MLRRRKHVRPCLPLCHRFVSGTCLRCVGRAGAGAGVAGPAAGPAADWAPICMLKGSAGG